MDVDKTQSHYLTWVIVFIKNLVSKFTDSDYFKTRF